MADVQQGGTPTFRALAYYWVVSALIVGAAAGIPWAWMLYGLLPSAAFALTAGAYSLIQWRVVRRTVRIRPIRTTMVAVAVGGTVGAIVASTLGRVGSYTWFDAAARTCFRLEGEPVPGANFFDQRRDVCNPEIGWIALTGYAIAAMGFGLALSRVRRLASKDEPSRVRAMVWGGALVASLALLAAQTVCSASLVAGQTPWACGCLKSGGGAVRPDR